MQRHIYLVAGLLAVLASAAAVARAAEKNEMTQVRSIEGITEYKLANGLKVLFFPDDSKPKVTVNIVYFVGSRHEGYGEAGMAHLLEHMLFKGTPTHDHIPKDLTQRGAEFNGTTWVDRTNYYETLPASEENLDFALKLEADRMINSRIRAEDLSSEMTVVRNEFEQGENTPSYILSQRMMAAAYEWHNYGKSTIGNRADIERVPVEKLRPFYKKYYQPDNAMLVVAGKFDPEKAKTLVEKYFGSIPKPARVLDNTYTEEPVQDGERVVTLRRVGDVSVVSVLYHVCAGAHPEFASIDVLESILTNPPAGRLYKALVESKKASRVRGALYSWHDPGTISFTAEVSKGNDPQIVLETMIETIEQVPADGVTAEEVDRAKRKLLKERELEQADSGGVAIELSEWAAQGDWRLYFLYRDRIEKVTRESVQAVAAKYFKQSNRTVGIFIPTEKPDRSSVPETPDLATMIGEYKGRENAVKGEAFDVSPANIEAHTRRSVLPGGIKIALLKKATRSQAVSLRLSLHYGSEESLKEKASECDFLPLLMTRGTKQMTRQQINDSLDAQNAQLHGSGNPADAEFSIETKRDNLPTVLQILKQILREPTLPESELEVLKRSRISSLDQARKDPNSLAQRAVRRTMYPYPKDDPRYVPTIDEEIAMVGKVTAAGLAMFYQQFLGGQHGELAIVGDFDEKAVEPILKEMFADWKAPQPFERIRYLVNKDVRGTTIEILTPGKANAMYFGSEAIPMSDADPDYPAMVIADFVLGGGSLSSRLADRVRQQQGLSYGVGSGFQARALDPRAAFYMYAICNPANMEKVKVAIREELDRLLAKGVTDKEMESAKAGYLQSKEVDRTSDEGLAYILNETSEDNRTMAYYSDLEKKIQSLTVDQVSDTFRKHIDPKRLIIATAGDFSTGDKEKSKPDGKSGGKK